MSLDASRQQSFADIRPAPTNGTTGVSSSGERAATLVARMLPLAEVQVNPRLQCRVRLDPECLSDFIKAVLREEQFPPVVVFRIDGALWLVDGHHRLTATRKAGRSEILAVVHDGTWPDAVRAALAANQKHGLRLSAADREAAVLLATKEFEGISTRATAELCGVSARTVRRVLKRAGGALPHLGAMTHGRDGKRYHARKARSEVPAELARTSGLPAKNQPVAPISSAPPPLASGVPAAVAPTPTPSLHPAAIMARNYVWSAVRHWPAAAADIAQVLRDLLGEISAHQH